jgi:hypothetical protein
VSVKSAPYYWLVCDKCAVRSTESGEHSAWMDEAQAIDDAEESDWLIEADLHLCEDCSLQLVCPECGERKGQDDAFCADCAATAEATA